MMLVIFDCDGVLVDTENPANERLAAIITAAGLPIAMPACRRRFNGLSMQAVRDRLLAEDGVDLGVDFAERWQSELPAVFSRGVDAIAGIRPVLDRLAANRIAHCVASSGAIAKMHMTLGAAGLLHLLADRLYSSSMVERGKPHPDLFLHAAKKMGFAPEDAVVVEDSVPGVVAGVAAGMRVLAYAGDPLTDRDGLAAAGGEVFLSMNRLPSLLGLE